jgi:hypothetical protein
LYATGLFTGVWPSVEDTVFHPLPEEGRSDEEPALVVRTDARGPLSLVGAPGFDEDRGGRIWGSLESITAVGGAPTQLAAQASTDGIHKWGALSLRVPTVRPVVSAWSAGGYASKSKIRFLGAEEIEVKRNGGWLGLESRSIAPSWFSSLTFRAEHVKSDLGDLGNLYRLAFLLAAEPPLVQIIGTSNALELEGGLGRSGSRNFARARAKGSYPFRMSHLSLAPLGDIEAISNGTPLDLRPALGDEYLVPALRWGEWRGRIRLVGGADLSYVVPLKTTIVLRLRGGMIDEPVRPDATPSDDDQWVGGASLSSLWWLPLGRVEVGVAAGTLGDRRVFVRLGPDF